MPTPLQEGEPRGSPVDCLDEAHACRGSEKCSADLSARPSQQSKKELERIVNGALNLDDDHPVKIAMQAALKSARDYARSSR